MRSRALSSARPPQGPRPDRGRRLVAEDDQVELDLLAPDRVDDRSRRRLRVPLLAARDEVDRAVGADRHALAELLLRLRRTEREHDRLAALSLDDPHRLLDA